MDSNVAAVGARIRGRLTDTQSAFAGQVEMTPDALSRALNGQRGFSSIELVRIADALRVDLTWLITGREDPYRRSFAAARHRWDAADKTHTNPDAEADALVLDRIGGLYRAAYPRISVVTRDLPRDAAETRAALGTEFVRDFARLVEEKLDVDVVRVAEVKTDYSLRVGERGVIVLRSTRNWFRSNWSLAHELGHLVLGHHAQESALESAQEVAANRFAGDLLLPAREMRRVPWDRIDAAALAGFLWSTGVSTATLSTRLKVLKLPGSSTLHNLLDGTTQAVLRSAGAAIGGRAVVSDREQAALARRFPAGLLEALTDRVAAGSADPRELAWALAVEVDDIDFPEPDEDVEAAAFAAVLADRPALGDLG